MNRNNESLLRDDSGSDPKKSKVEDTISLSMTIDTLINKSFQFVFNNMNENIRFTPKTIAFIDAFEGKQFAEKFRIQNVGRNPVHIKIGEPNSFIFQLKKPIRRAKLLPSGCSITRTVSYTYHSDDLVASSLIPVQINGCYACVPIIVKKAIQNIGVEPRTLDFKIISAGATPKKMTLTILNTGGKRTKFEIDFKTNFLNLAVNPMRGIVKAKNFVNVTVEVMGLSEGEYYQELWIKTAELPIRVPVLVEIIRPRLEITYPNGTEDLTLITFPPTFNGTQKLGSFVFKNYSVENTLFIILGEVNGELQLLKNARSSTTAFKMFTLAAEEGYLKPFEDRIINVMFAPITEQKKKGWHHEECNIKNQTQHKYIVFFRIVRVHCLGPEELRKIEMKCSHYLQEKKALGQETNYSFSSEENLENFDNFTTNSEQQIDYLRLCFLGEAVEPDIVIQPSSFELGDLFLGQTKNRVLKITNNSAIAVKCKIGKICNVKTTPNEVWLKSEKAQEFLITLLPTYAGRFNKKIEVQILAESDIATSKNKTLEIIAVYNIILTYNTSDVPSIPFPKIGLGITPLITDEVGLQKELITFKDAFKFPDAAILGVKQGFRPAWMKEENKLNSVDNAVIALSNDRPGLFYSWPKDKVWRAIFTGFCRYSPPDDLTYTLSPDGRIEKKKRRAIWADYISVLRELRLAKYSNLKELEFYLKYEMPCKKDQKMESFKLSSKTPKFKTFKTFLEQCECFPKNTFVPLTPLFLLNIIVEPKLISFEMVCVDVMVQETITVNNGNPFPISIRLITDKLPVSLLEEGLIIIPPTSSKSIHVLFQTNILGRYLGFVNYIINESHTFKISITANVVPNTFGVKVTPDDLSAGSEKDPCCSLSGFLMNRNSDPLKLSNKKLGVEFLSNEINMHDISLNFPYKIRPVIQNAGYYDVCFEIICTMPGITVEPQRGMINARSFCHLDVRVQIPVIMKFSFEIILIVNLSENISLKVTGNVLLPDIRMRPLELIMRKISAHSFETFGICVENGGNTPAEMEINFKNWPEFRVADGQSKFYLPPKKSSKIIINFEPIDVARYVFYLPIIINDLLGPPMIQQRTSEYVHFYTSDFEDVYRTFGEVFNTKTSKLKIPFVCVNSTVTQNLIRLSSRNINFLKESNFDSGPQNVEIFNDFTDEVTFCIRNDDLGELNDSPFNLIPLLPHSVEYRLKSMKALIKRGEKLQFKVTFDPKKPGLFSADVPIFVRGYSHGLVYNYIHLRGELKPPCISPEVSEVHFPPLPLGIGCDVTITVRLENYNNSEIINCLVCDQRLEGSDCEQKCLTTNWVKEPNVSQNGMPYICRLRIQFQSFVPIALRSYILLFDSTGVYATVLVTAVADNSCVTDHGFLSTKACKYKLVRNEPPLEWKTDEIFHKYPVNKFDLKLQSDIKANKNRSKSIDGRTSDSSKVYSSPVTMSATNNASSWPIDKGPRLVIQMTKSMTRPTDLNYVKIIKRFTESESKSSSSSTALEPVKSDALSHVTNQSFKISKMSYIPPNTDFKRSDPSNDNSYPYFPTHDSDSRKYFQGTLSYIERWIFEVVMRCDQYFSIPRSFQKVKESLIMNKPSENKKKSERNEEKDFLDFLTEIIERDRNLPERPTFDPTDSPVNKTDIIRLYYAKLLQFLENKGCLLPHIRPEYLMEYENYAIYSKFYDNIEFFSWKYTELEKVNSVKILVDQANVKNKPEKEESFNKGFSEFSNDPWKQSSFDDLFQTGFNEVEKTEEQNPDIAESHKQLTDLVQNFWSDKQFEYKTEILDKAAFDSRSTQAWLDIIIQVFKVFVLAKIIPKCTIPQIVAFEKSEKILTEAVNLSTVYNYNKTHKGYKVLPSADLFNSNIYSIQERTLLVWLNHHLQVQKEILWKSQGGCLFRGKVLNNFDKDLSDSVVLIAVTASHCPYIVTNYFKGVFPKPDGPAQVHHNAEKLLEAWKTLALGFTLKISDIVNPNPIFMVMLVTYLYEFLPSLHPHSLICFSAPLNSEITRTLLLKNESRERIVYRARFFGECEELFQLGDQSIVELKHSKVTSLNVKFTVKKIKKISATLFLNTLSPNFAKHLTFYFEGEPSEFPEYEKFTFTVPLYKVICAKIPVNSPYSGSETYEIWYTTKQPEYSGWKHQSFHFLLAARSTFINRLCPTSNIAYPSSNADQLLKAFLHCRKARGGHIYGSYCSTYTNQTIVIDIAERQPGLGSSFKERHTNDILGHVRAKTDIETLFKPWSKIWNTKVSRRLFLNNFKVAIHGKQMLSSLDVTIACLTNQKRLFWLLFHSTGNDFIILVEIKPKLLEFRSLTAGFCSKDWSPSASCTCLPENKLKANSNNCPFFTNIMIPKRNDALWNALRTMFFKALNPKEKPFWAEQFEMNNGLFLILWLLSPEEEIEVVDEFVQVLSTKVTYSLNLESNAHYVNLPSKIEISDVREASDIAVPIHISKNAPLPLNLKLMMTSENEKEIRILKVFLHPPNSDKCTTVTFEGSGVTKLVCEPSYLGETLKPCKSKKKKKV